MNLNPLWRPLPGFDGYAINVDGSITWVGGGGRGKRPGKFLSPRPASNGYLEVRIRKDGKSHIVAVHRTVCAAFLGPCPEGLHVRHLDGDKANNRLSNLCYGTPKENAADNVRLGVTVRGSDHHEACLSQDQAQEIVDFLAAGASPTAIAMLLEVPRNAVYKIKYGESWAWLNPSANNRAIDRAET